MLARGLLLVCWAVGGCGDNAESPNDLGVGVDFAVACTHSYLADGKPCDSVGAICLDPLTYPCDCVGTPGTILCCGDNGPPFQCQPTPGLAGDQILGRACCGNDACYDGDCVGGARLRCACAGTSMTTFIGAYECHPVPCATDGG
jgi:hypothetical protein